MSGLDDEELEAIKHRKMVELQKSIASNSAIIYFNLFKLLSEDFLASCNSSFNAVKSSFNFVTLLLSSLSIRDSLISTSLISLDSSSKLINH